MKAHLISLQYALFFKDVVERPDVEFSILNETMLNLFDSIPSSTPVPRELPNDIPIVSLRNEGASYICNIARSRIDLHYKRTEGETTNSEILKDFNSKAQAFVKFVLSKQDLTRFGMVCNYFIEDNASTHTLKKKYFSGAINDPEELSLRFNNLTKCDSLQLNDIVEIGKATIKIGGEDKKGISIQRDINNIASGRDLSFDDLLKVSKHFSGMISEMGVEALIK